MPTILSISPSRALDLNGFAVPGALATFYNSGTTRQRTVYADPECTVPHPSPVAANGAGVFPPIFDTGGGDAKVLVTDPDGVTLAGYPIDPVLRVTTDVTGAESVSFDPTVEIPETDVQAAIERVQQNIVEPLADFGLGVTGNATLLSNIDAPGIASGAYRYDATTAGTYPNSVTADAGGSVRVWRESSGEAIMILSPRGSTRQYVRSLTDGAWDAWAYGLRSTDTTSDAIWAAGTSTTPYAATPAAVAAGVGAQALGVGQSWRDVTGNRNNNTTYTNTTGRPIMVAITADGAPSDVQVSANGSNWVRVGRFGEAGLVQMTVNFVVPEGHRYRTQGDPNLLYWAELR